jgi:hypothetical protein
MIPLSELKYKTGIPTLRSSSHRVRYSTEKASRNKNAPKPKRTSKNITDDDVGYHSSSHGGTMLPLSIRKIHHVPYDTCKYNLKGQIAKLLQSLDSAIVGNFASCEEEDSLKGEIMSKSLEYFEVPQISLTRKKQKGNCEASQEYLSQAVASSAEFLECFDLFVNEVVLPHLKSRLIKEDIVDESALITMYYQRPPTLRLQPGPARASVKAHKDSDYGHQPGELNYWIPLTDRNLTGVDLYAETDEDVGDFMPLESDFGFASSFHGSNCRHYVNTNVTKYTRVSLDFRVGIEPFYDPTWEMIGTKDDHNRCEVKI